MNTLDGCIPDVMQVCRNGHVITDLLHTFPERGLSHCDRCGAATLERCATCGRDLPGAVYVPGLVPMGLLAAPQFCSTCGVAFPWSKQPAATKDPRAVLENLLRRLPRAIRELRSRHGQRPPFRVEDVHDLEDLMRALLPLHFDDVRPESRTPSYAADTRMAFLLAPESVVVVVKRTGPGVREKELAVQWAEDVACYERAGTCRCLVVFIDDANAVLASPRQLETAWSRSPGELEVRCVIVQ
jgi:hypothetical protein